MASASSRATVPQVPALQPPPLAGPWYEAWLRMAMLTAVAAWGCATWEGSSGWITAGDCALAAATALEAVVAGGAAWGATAAGLLMLSVVGGGGPARAALLCVLGAQQAAGLVRAAWAEEPGSAEVTTPTSYIPWHDRLHNIARLGGVRVAYAWGVAAAVGCWAAASWRGGEVFGGLASNAAVDTAFLLVLSVELFAHHGGPSFHGTSLDATFYATLLLLWLGALFLPATWDVGARRVFLVLFATRFCLLPATAASPRPLRLDADATPASAYPASKASADEASSFFPSESGVYGAIAGLPRWTSRPSQSGCHLETVPYNRPTATPLVNCSVPRACAEPAGHAASSPVLQQPAFLGTSMQRPRAPV